MFTGMTDWIRGQFANYCLCDSVKVKALYKCMEHVSKYRNVKVSYYASYKYHQEIFVKSKTSNHCLVMEVRRWSCTLLKDIGCIFHIKSKVADEFYNTLS